MPMLPTLIEILAVTILTGHRATTMSQQTTQTARIRNDRRRAVADQLGQRSRGGRSGQTLSKARLPQQQEADTILRFRPALGAGSAHAAGYRHAKRPRH